MFVPDFNRWKITNYNPVMQRECLNPLFTSIHTYTMFTYTYERKRVQVTTFKGFFSFKGDRQTNETNTVTTTNSKQRKTTTITTKTNIIQSIL